ncbi:predicted protein [Histoplasma capsulatum G186AR]|uniref:Uncharacterized protein n=1 Tax=Ajellomyces capsulatus (strain G186AR / H82 / ATCC MYA-2454 / RMSCC 2432) TaxID=447093 RepID=C0NTD1_AJECG|nr:uncharacterized protein HCBG_06411 [Histoplasma capsulatum G186AR]EEH05292.1 predicted protein [Histoplasma capsulatum G186AR]
MPGTKERKRERNKERIKEIESENQILSELDVTTTENAQEKENSCIEVRGISHAFCSPGPRCLCTLPSMHSVYIIISIAPGDGWLKIGDRNELSTNYDDSSQLAISRIITIVWSKLLLIPGVLDDLLHCGSPELQEYQFQHEAAELPDPVLYRQLLGNSWK